MKGSLPKGLVHQPEFGAFDAHGPSRIAIVEQKLADQLPTERTAGGQAAPRGPTKPSPQPPGLTSVLQRNIHSLQERREREEAKATFEERIAQVMTRFTGSMRFVYLHLAISAAGSSLI